MEQSLTCDWSLCSDGLWHSRPESASTLYQSAQGLLSRYRACWNGVRVLAAAEGSSVPARLSPPPLSTYGPAGGNRSRFRAGWCGGVKTRVRVAGNSDLQRNAIFGTPQASSARLTLEARTVRDVRRSTPLRLDARGRKDASAEPKELFSRGPQMSIRPYGSSRGIAKASWGQNARDRRRGLARPLRMGPQRVRSIPLAR